MAAPDATRQRTQRDAIAAVAVWIVLAPLGVALARAVASLPRNSGLANEALGNLERSGVDNPVTAVLMNFRGYDTLLELAVLFVAVLGVWSAAATPRRHVAEAPTVLRVLNRLLVPFLMLFAAYLLWAGSHAAGGAFQAGAVAAAAGVLVVLSGHPAQVRLPHGLLRVLILLGPATFAAVALGTVAAGNELLEYPQAYAKPLILLIEAAATVSIATMLVAAFRGGKPLHDAGGGPSR